MDKRMVLYAFPLLLASLWSMAVHSDPLCLSLPTDAVNTNPDRHCTPRVLPQDVFAHPSGRERSAAISHSLAPAPKRLPRFARNDGLLCCIQADLAHAPAQKVIERQPGLV